MRGFVVVTRGRCTPLRWGSTPRCLATSKKDPTILVIGCLGQIGQELVPELRRRFPGSNVLMSDVRKPFGNLKNEKVRYIDLTSTAMLTDVVIRKISFAYVSSLLRVVGKIPHDVTRARGGWHTKFFHISSMCVVVSCCD
jgi:hypothetical protein